MYNLSFCLFWVDFMFPNIINFIIIFRQIGQMHPILFLVTKCSRFLSDYDIFGIKCLQGVLHYTDSIVDGWGAPCFDNTQRQFFI